MSRKILNVLLTASTEVALAPKAINELYERRFALLKIFGLRRSARVEVSWFSFLSVLDNITKHRRKTEKSAVAFSRKQH